MIIDIDIKIADGDGNLLHRLEKRIDKFDYISESPDLNSGIDKSFEDFLSEYLSHSGRVIRERLIYDIKIPPEGNIGTKFPMEQENSPSNESRNQINERDVEYRISIGSKNVFMGKFPFRFLSDVKNPEDDLIAGNTDIHEDNLISHNKDAHEDNLISHNKDKDNPVSYDTDNYVSNLNSYAANNFESNLNSYDRDDFEEEWDILSTMAKAIEKYEENFYLIHTEEEPYITT